MSRARARPVSSRRTATARALPAARNQEPSPTPSTERAVTSENVLDALGHQLGVHVQYLRGLGASHIPRSVRRKSSRLRLPFMRCPQCRGPRIRSRPGQMRSSISCNRVSAASRCGPVPASAPSHPADSGSSRAAEAGLSSATRIIGTRGRRRCGRRGRGTGGRACPGLAGDRCFRLRHRRDGRRREGRVVVGVRLDRHLERHQSRVREVEHQGDRPPAAQRGGQAGEHDLRHRGGQWHQCLRAPGSPARRPASLRSRWQVR
jgi:hypothetical protein